MAIESVAAQPHLFSPPQSSQEVLTASHLRSSSFSAPLLGGLLQMPSELGQPTFRVFWKSLKVCPQSQLSPVREGRWHVNLPSLCGQL